MSLKPLLSFASGELDPVLTDNVTLEKFNKGLATGRNVIIGKTGSIMSRFSRYHCFNAKNAGEAVKIYCPPNTDYVLEFGNLYVKVYGLVTGFQSPSVTEYVELVHALVEADLPNLHFETSKDYVYVFCAGKQMLKLHLNSYASVFITAANMFAVPNPFTLMTHTAGGAPSGYPVDYMMTLVINGEESLAGTYVLSGALKPIAAGQSNTVVGTWVTATVNASELREARVYSRPSAGAAFGYLGSTTRFTIVGANTTATFEDLGSLPDFNNGEQDLITKYGLNGQAVNALNPKTGLVYQQRLIISTEDDEEALLTSRPGFQNNFYRDFPYAADSSLQFKAGSSGKAKVLRLIEKDGLINFTENGIHINTGLLSVNNLAMPKVGSWVINEAIPPLVIPGGVFFVDRSNTIRQLQFSQEIQAYESIEQTIFSNHLFKKRLITSWCFQDGVAPLIIVTFSDGDFATFNYNYEHQMKAWTRSDSVYPVEQVEGTGKNDRSFFVVNKDGQRSIEVTLPRVLPVEVLVEEPEAHMFAPTAFMDSIVSSTLLLNNFLTAGENFVLAPVVADTWDGNLTLTSSDGLLDFTATTAIVGSILRFFNPADGAYLDMEVVSFTSDFILVVTPSEEFPEAYATSANIYNTFNTVTGLDHLEGEEVSIMVDGSVVASPYNDEQNYPGITVVGGELDLPNSLRGAIVHVGRPIVADVKTLNISTAEQSPTLLESLNVNKLYIRVNDTRGLYCSNKFPEEATGGVDGTGVDGMEDLSVDLVPSTDQIIGNRYLPPISKRLEKTIPGTWEGQGQISLRQVDPFHFEILSIIPDITILSRSDR